MKLNQHIQFISRRIDMKSEKGQGLVEYAIILVLVAIVVIAIILTIIFGAVIIAAIIAVIAFFAHLFGAHAALFLTTTLLA